jgi:hypothetical protein
VTYHNENSILGWVKFGFGDLRVVPLIYKGDVLSILQILLKVISTNSLICHIKKEPDWFLNCVAVMT